MRIHFGNSRKAKRSTAVILGGAMLAVIGCSSLLDVKNPNDVAESALDNPAAAAALQNGVLAATVRMLSGITVPYAVSTDELDWIGSRDAWGELDKGAISDFVNEFTDGAFPYVGEARFLGDLAIGKLEKFDADGKLNDKRILARTYLYTAVVYTSIADMYDDYAFSEKTKAAAPVGRANMGTLYDKAVAYLDKAKTIADASTDGSLKYAVTAYRARVKHAKAVWATITPQGSATPANPLVNDAGANADASAAIAMGTADEAFTLEDNLEATAGINIWYEVNGRNEHALGAVYRNLIDPVSGVRDTTVGALLQQFKDFGTLSGVFTITSTRELRLILAEAALATGDMTGFATQLNAVRSLDGKPDWTGTPAAQTMLAYERQAQLWLMRRRLSDMYRFGQKDSKWATDPNFDSAFNVVGLLFPIPNVERLGNPCIEKPELCTP